MSSTASPLTPASRQLRSTPPAFAAALIAAAIPSIALSAFVAAIAHAAGAPHAFKALDLDTYTPLIVIGLLAATIAWTLIRTRAANPQHLLRWLAPAVVGASLLPDLAVVLTNSLAGSSWGGVIALMAMHLIVAACGIASLIYFLPLRRA